MTEALALPAPRAHAPWPEAWQRSWPVLTVIATLLVLWYAAAIWLNAPQVIERLNGLGDPWNNIDLVAATWAMERPVLPAPHQIAQDFWSSIADHEVDSPRSLVFHAGVTLTATLLGFALAITAVNFRVLGRE